MLMRLRQVMFYHQIGVHLEVVGVLSLADH